MPSYMAPNQDIQFVLHEVLKVAQNDTPGYDELDAEFTSAVLEEAGKLASEVLAPSTPSAIPKAARWKTVSCARLPASRPRSTRCAKAAGPLSTVTPNKG